MRRVISIGSALALLVFAAAFVVLLIPQPCAPAAPGSRFTPCIAPNLAEGFLLALVASALAMPLALATVYHSLISQKRGFAALLGLGALGVTLLFALSPLINGVALLAIFAAPLLATATLLYSGASAPRKLTPAEKTE
jgi:hypothetical protein